MLSLGAKEKSLIGDAHSFECAVSPLLPSLKAYCRSVARSCWDADDLEQETLEKAYARFKRTGVTPITKAYLYRIASNAWIDRHRRSREIVKPTEWSGWEAAYLRDGVDDIERMRWAVEQLIILLTPKQRTALLLTEVFGLTLQETADRLSMAVGSVKSLLHRARARLQREACDEEAGLSASAASADMTDAYVQAVRHGLLETVVALGVEAGPLLRASGVGASAIPRAAALVGFAVTSDGACTAVIGGRAPRVLSFRAGDAIAA
jgi:RNA polymerase sigma factor (sigma-70 family)